MILKLIQFYRRIRHSKYGWFGRYNNWQEAQQHATGYNADNILQKVKAATLKVKKDEAVYERDSMLFDHIEYSWPLLANLLTIAMQKNNTLSVIDFGGSLGSTFFQNRKYFSQLKSIRWNVVEQQNYVAAGQADIAGNGLGFYYSIDDVIQEQGIPDVLVLGCVLPYIEKPYKLIATLAAKSVPYIIVDNTYFNDEKGDRLTVQNVSPDYYEASYPAWFLDYEKVKDALRNKYEIMEEYVNEQFLYLYGRKIEYRGFIARLK